MNKTTFWVAFPSTNTWDQNVYFAKRDIIDFYFSLDFGYLSPCVQILGKTLYLSMQERDFMR